MFDRFGLLEPYVSCSKIIDVNQGTLYLGDYQSALDIVKLKVHNIKTLISIVTQIDIKYNEINHRIIYINDKEDQDIKQYFDKTFDWIDKGLSIGSVLVHCGMGISRSSTIVIAYLIKKLSYPFAKAYNHVRKMRPIISPNIGFSKQLKEYERMLQINKSQSFQLKTVLVQAQFSYSVPRVDYNKKLLSRTKHIEKLPQLKLKSNSIISNCLAIQGNNRSYY
ncbi:hypothetical protein pb186bvf_017812 [Paramecium bursaria]